jgi:hypothetical protein
MHWVLEWYTVCGSLGQVSCLWLATASGRQLGGQFYSQQE